MNDKKKPKLIKLGWDRLDEKTKTKMKKLGIRGLGRTPGKLITAKGHIDGYLSAFGTVWGKISFTPDQAEKAMGFRPKQGAIGVLLSRRRYIDDNGKVKSGIFAISLMPRSVILTEKMRLCWDRMTILSKISSIHKTDLIHPIWDPIKSNRNKWGGTYYFKGLNSQRLGTSLNWTKLLISDGKLHPPKHMCPCKYDFNNKQIQIFIPKTIKRTPITINQIGIGILDSLTGDFFHISPENIIEHLKQKNQNNPTWNLTWKLEKIRKYSKPQNCPKLRFYIYNYYKKQNDYSPSICSRIKSWKTSIHGRGGIPAVINIIT